MSRGLLAVQVFPGGILLKPRFMRSAVILKSEITGLGVKQALLGGRYVEVTPTSSGVNSPLVLYVSPESDIARAIEQITGMRLASAVAGSAR
jgi:hypothetical protein